METQLNVKLLRHTPEPEKAIASSARLCYSKSDINDLLEKMDDEKSAELLDKLVSMGHESPTEHVSFTFGVEGVSRALTHQLVRHRIASYSQQSQRYVTGKNFKFIMPPSIKQNPESEKKFLETMKLLGEAYEKLNETAPKEDARFILPNATETKIMITMNARSLRNFFDLRCCLRAQWEIRNMACEMLKQSKEAAPILFKKMGPKCVRLGYCPEGKMTCGQLMKVKEAYKDNDWDKVKELNKYGEKK